MDFKFVDWKKKAQKGRKWKYALDRKERKSFE